MKITHYQKGTNQYKKKRKLKKIVKFIFLVLIIGLAYKTYQNLKPKVITVEKQTDICQGNSSCQAKITNLAKQTLLQAEIDKEKALYEAKMTDLNNQMETLRKEELSFK